MTRQCAFARRIESLHEMFAFAAMQGERLPAVEFAIEELFTNMLKYGHPGESEVWMEIDENAASVEVTLIDRDVQPFDPTRSPDARVELPLQQREPGGLGLHLTRRLVDGLHYQYIGASRESRIRFRVTRSQPRAASEAQGGQHADD